MPKPDDPLEPLLGYRPTHAVYHDVVEHYGWPFSLLLPAATELTIATGVVTITQGHHTIDTEADAATDDLDTINGLAADMVYLLRPADTARTVVFKHGTGNIYCVGGSDITCDDDEDFVWGFSPDGLIIYVLQSADLAGHVAAADPHTGYQKESEKDAASGYAGLTAGTKLNLAQMQEVMAYADLTDDPVGDHLADAADAHDASAISILDTAGDFTATDVEGALAELQADAEAHEAGANEHHAQAHGPAEHLGGNAWRMVYQNAFGAEIEFTLGAAGTVLTSAGASAAPTFDTIADEDIDVTGMKQTIALTAAGGAPTTTAGCAAVAKVEAATNDVDYWVLDFDPTTQEYAFWGPIPMPDNWDGGTLTARFYWTAASGSGGVRWGIQLLSRGDDDAIDAAYGTAQEVSDTLLAAGDEHISAETSAITAAGTPAGGEKLYIRAYRLPTHADDTLAADARLTGVKLEYGVSALSA